METTNLKIKFAKIQSPCEDEVRNIFMGTPTPPFNPLSQKDKFYWKITTKKRCLLQVHFYCTAKLTFQKIRAYFLNEQKPTRGAGLT